MMLVILAAVFAVLGIALIVIPFHVAMTGICFWDFPRCALSCGFCAGKNTKGRGA